MENKELIEATGKLFLLDMKWLPNIKDLDTQEIVRLAQEKGIQVVVPKRPEPTLQEAIKVLQKHLREDKSEGSYYNKWQSKIAMNIYEIYAKSNIENKTPTFHNICLEVAKNFLDLLIKE